MTRRARLLLTGLLLAAVAVSAGACGDAGVARGPTPSIAVAPTAPPNVTDLPQPPEAYGLVSLAQLQADPAGAARALTGQLGASPWTVVWKVSVAGEESGTMTLEHLPPQDGGSGRLHVRGEFRAGDTRNVEIHVLDDGGGARVCVREKQQPYVCDKKDFGVLSQFLSVGGLSQLTSVVHDGVAKPGAAVQYKMIASEPATCFVLPPQALGTATLGVDFESGGTVCLSRLGAILKLETGTLDIEAAEYTTTADAANFRMPA